MIRVNEVKLSINEGLENLVQKLEKILRVGKDDIIEFKIFRESIDARKEEIFFVYTIDVKVKNEEKILKKNKKFSKTPDFEYKDVPSGNMKSYTRPVIIGFGPSGAFAALVLAQRGYRPIVLERGQKVSKRTEDVDNFWKTGVLNPESNVQFGEGGAGTFSDGKLTTRIKDKRCRKVLQELVSAGAPQEILYSYKPHIGTDILKTVVKNIRQSIEELGGEVRFGSKVTDFLVEKGKLIGLEINGKAIIETDDVIMGIGHSARDTYKVLEEREILIKQKPFSIGVRIEHPQTLINKSQYNMFAQHPRLGAADYRLTYKTIDGRTVYTFCMCPGGSVVAAASEEGCVVTNGMSEYARDKPNANSALLVQVVPEDFESNQPLAGVEFQRRWEHAAFIAGGMTYWAPAQKVGDFLKGCKSSEPGTLIPSYKPGVIWNDLTQCLPSFVVSAMKEAIKEMDKKLKGFAMEDAILTGVETRSSAPVRIVRDEKSMESFNTKGLFPVGEGAGYAGGIGSAAVDGIKAAEKIIIKYVPQSLS